MPPAALAASTASCAPLRVGWPSAAAPPDSGSVTPSLSSPFEGAPDAPPAAVLAPEVGAAEPVLELHAASARMLTAASALTLCSFIQSPPSHRSIPTRLDPALDPAVPA